LALIISAALPARSQMPEPYLSLGGRPWDPSSTCVGAPGPCEGETHFIEYGAYEFSVSRVPWDFGSVDHASLTFHWPAGWTLLGYEVCYGQLESGDPSVPGSPVAFSFPDCPDEEIPFFRAWFDCPGPGTFSATPDPASLRDCSGRAVEELMGLYVSVGDECGMHPHGHCDLCQYHGEAAYFDPSSCEITLGQGASHDTVLVASGNTGPYCNALPECGPGWGADFAGMATDREWMTVQMLDYEGGSGFQQVHYRLTISNLLPPGDHTGRVYALGGCDSWDSCMPVTVHVPDVSGVLPPAHAIAPTPVLGLPAPNPTRGAIEYTIQLPVASPARVVVFNAAGQMVGPVLEEYLPAGSNRRAWNPGQGDLSRIPTGVYFLRLDTPLGRDSRIFVLRR
ncbi:MAG TPA: T9SS type A sorting domain-containing protein, partial [Candidatus Bipolaricaulis anaerobius]|nr:T9SS type A sorting domain-containing protein [Candidatus Bipolaricaulis anaerobius]